MVATKLSFMGISATDREGCDLGKLLGPTFTDENKPPSSKNPTYPTYAVLMESIFIAYICKYNFSDMMP